MSIFLKEKEVRENELDREIEVSFNDLNENGQKRMFEENKDLFLTDAIISRYKNIREIAENYVYEEECSNIVLNQLILQFFYAQGRYTNRYITIILKLLNIPRLKLLNTTQRIFAESDNYILKKWLTEYSGTSNEDLNIMLNFELKKFWNNESDLVDKIIMHPNFELTLEGKYCGFGYIEKVEARIKELRGK